MLHTIICIYDNIIFSCQVSQPLEIIFIAILHFFILFVGFLEFRLLLFYKIASLLKKDIPM
jgi:hypothetical protein